MASVEGSFYPFVPIKQKTGFGQVTAARHRRWPYFQNLFRLVGRIHAHSRPLISSMIGGVACKNYFPQADLSFLV
jgi:hypothetical protein